MTDAIYIIKRDNLQTTYDQLIELANLRVDAPLIDGKKSDAPDPLSEADFYKYENRYRRASKNEVFRLETSTPTNTVISVSDIDIIKKIYAALNERDLDDNGKIDSLNLDTDLIVDLRKTEEIKDPEVTHPGVVGFDDATMKRALATVESKGTAVFTIKTKVSGDNGGEGTGYIVGKKQNPDGTFTYEVATNSHVVDSVYQSQIALENALETGYVLLSANGEIEINNAVLVGTDPLTDAAVLRFSSSYNLPVCEWGDSDNIKVFDPIISYGNSLGADLRPAVGRVLANEQGSSQPLFPLIRINPTITNGNSGGPIFNLDGQVIGTTVQVYSFGIFSKPNFEDGLLIPSNDMKAAVDRILASEMTSHPGSVAYGDWGVQVLPVSAEVRKAFLPANLDQEALQIVKIEEGSPAEKAGLQEGDLIIAVDGSSEPLRASETEHLYRFYQVELLSKPGSKHELTIFRPGEWVENISLTTAEKTYGPVPVVIKAGIAVQNITPEIRSLYGFCDDVQGVLVLEDNSTAEISLDHLVISAINGVPIQNTEDFVKLMTAAETDGKPATVLSLTQTSLEANFDNGGVNGRFYEVLTK